MHLCLIITSSFNLGARRQMPEPPPGSGTGSGIIFGTNLLHAGSICINGINEDGRFYAFIQKYSLVVCSGHRLKEAGTCIRVRHRVRHNFWH